MKKIVILVCLILWGGGAFAADAISETEKGERASIPSTYESFDSLFTLYQPYLANISAYQPIYFLMGANPEESRFQISLKYQLFSETCPIALCKPWLAGFHLGYTQTSSWDLKSDSAPFEDTSYKPEIFFLSKNMKFRPGLFKGLFFQTGVLHESNGQADDRSRSTNMLYVKPIAIMYSESTGYGLQISPKITSYFNNSDSTNPEFKDYRGPLELELKAGKTDGLVLDTSLRWAKEGTSLQLDLTYPISLSIFSNLSLYLHAQYADALAETLLNYKERTQAFRIGISLVR